MLIEEQYIKEAARYLSIFAEYTKTISQLNLNDNSVVAENFFARVLNVVYGYELENLNMVKQNAAVVDLYDENRRISVQVTSQSAPSKVKSCLKSFEEKELYKDYDTLYVYILTSKSKNGYSIDNVNLEQFHFNAKTHVLDKSDLLKTLMNKDTVIQKEVVDILKSGIKILDEEEIFFSNEEQTMINLIGLLSANQREDDFDRDTDIDPKKKIEKRFKDKAIIIDNQYFQLCLEYAPVLAVVEENNDIDSAKHSKVATYLKVRSSKLLIENKIDAVRALDILIEDVTTLFHDAKLTFDKMAIEYFLLKSLTECNVFPLLRGESDA
jgi:hypothetical protein